MKRAERIESVKNDLLVQHIKGVINTYGYDCSYIYVTSYGKPEINVRSKDRSFHWFTPDIYMRGHWDIAEKKYLVEGFEIQTTSYGALNPIEFQEMLDRLHDGLSCAKFLESVDWSKLPVMPEHFDDDADYEA